MLVWIMKYCYCEMCISVFDNDDFGQRVKAVKQEIFEPGDELFFVLVSSFTFARGTATLSLVMS